MRLHFITALLLLLLILSCSPKKQITENNKDDITVGFNMKEEYAPGERIEINIVNQSEKDSLYIHHPATIRIEKKVEGEWKKMRIRYCPCGASCPPPPEERLLIPGKAYHVTWDQKEEWCGEMTSKGIPETHKKMAGNGLYRIKVLLKKTNNHTIYTKTKQFRIQN